jgi:hypothetical protein
MNIYNLISKMLHKCDFKITNIPSSNEKGEIWIEACNCGKTQRVLFDNKGNCIDIKPL